MKNKNEMTAAPDNQTVSVSAIHTGLTSLAQSANKIAERVRSNPTELGTLTESGEAIVKQFSKLIDDVKKFDAAATKLQGTVGEVKKASDWVAGEFCGRGNDHVIGTASRVADF